MHNKYDNFMASLNSYFLPFRIPYDDNDIRDLEAQIKYALPEDYRHFIEKYAFACVRSAIYPSFKNPDKDGGAVESFLGFNPNNSDDLRRTARAFPDRIPDRYLPIAVSPGGLLCICLSGPERGGVYWWDRAEDHDDPERNMYLVWPDFDGFIRSLKPPPK